MVAPYKADSDARHAAPRAGADIITCDSERIGAVKESDSGHFKVDARWARDYWLSCDLIRSQEDDMVLLSIPSDAVPGYKLRRTDRGFEPSVGGLDLPENRRSGS